MSAHIRSALKECDHALDVAESTDFQPLKLGLYRATQQALRVIVDQMDDLTTETEEGTATPPPPAPPPLPTLPSRPPTPRAASASGGSSMRGSSNYNLFLSEVIPLVCAQDRTRPQRNNFQLAVELWRRYKTAASHEERVQAAADEIATFPVAAAPAGRTVDLAEE